MYIENLYRHDDSSVLCVSIENVNVYLLSRDVLKQKNRPLLHTAANRWCGSYLFTGFLSIHISKTDNPIRKKKQHCVQNSISIYNVKKIHLQNNKEDFVHCLFPPSLKKIPKVFSFITQLHMINFVFITFFLFHSLWCISGDLMHLYYDEVLDKVINSTAISKLVYTTLLLYQMLEIKQMQQ